MESCILGPQKLLVSIARQTKHSPQRTEKQLLTQGRPVEVHPLGLRWVILREGLLHLHVHAQVLLVLGVVFVIFEGRHDVGCCQVDSAIYIHQCNPRSTDKLVPAFIVACSGSQVADRLCSRPTSELRIAACIIGSRMANLTHQHRVETAALSSVAKCRSKDSTRSKVM